MKNIIINRVSLINILKIAFVGMIFVSGVGEVGAFLNPTTLEKPSTGDQDQACIDETKLPSGKTAKQVLESGGKGWVQYSRKYYTTCNYKVLGLNRSGFCIPTKTGSNLFCEDKTPAVNLCESSKDYYEGRPCTLDVGTVKTKGICIPNSDGVTNGEIYGVGGAQASNKSAHICQAAARDVCTYLNCSSKNFGGGPGDRPYCIESKKGLYTCSANDACGGCTSPEQCITNTEGKSACSTKKCDPVCDASKGLTCVETSANKFECKLSTEVKPKGYDTDVDDLTSSTNGPEPTIEYVEFKNPIRFNNLIELMAGITNALLTLLGVIAVLVIMSAGFKYMTSSNPGEVSQATGSIRNAVIGIAVIMGAYLIINYIISALI